MRAGWLAGGAAVVALGVWMAFSDWHEGEERAEIRVAGGDPERGRDLLYQWACGSCHEIPGVAGADGRVGPPLTDWAARQYIVGSLRNRPPELIRWIMDPQSIEPGSGMPDMGVPAEDARHMAAYLYTLGEADPLGPPHPFPLRWLERFHRAEAVGSGP